MHLTKKTIGKAKPPVTGVRFLRDDSLKGFGVKLTPKGTKTFFIEKEIHGRGRRMALGRFGEITLEQARTIAREKMVAIAQGKDPVEERRARRQAATWLDLETLYLNRHSSLNKSKSNDERNLRLHLAHLRPRRLTTLTKSDFAGLHADLGAAGHRTGANGVLALAKSMLARAREWGLTACDNPARDVKKFKLQPRERFLSVEELPRVWEALQRDPNPFVRVAVAVALLTGARKSEVLQMQWSDLDLSRSVWTIPHTKAGRPHVVPLPRPVIEELRKLPRMNGNSHVFVGRWGRKHLINLARPWERIRKEAGLPEVRIHDLRRTLASWLVAAGASLPLIGKTLNHSQPSTTAIYAKLQIEPVRLALENNAQKMLAVIGQLEGQDHAE